MRTISLYVLFFLLAFTACKGKQKNDLAQQTFTDSTDQELFNSIRQIATSNSFDSLEQGKRVVEVAKLLMQTPYVSGTLEGNETEQLVVNFRELDCTTYLENAVALSKAFSSKNTEASDFLAELEKLRYRDGKVDDYASRLHYFSDWLFENEKKGILRNVTVEIGGEKYDKTINFMSTHVESYAALQADSLQVEEIKKIEEKINQREMYYIPETEIKVAETKIQDGDIIAITTKIEGLDISHVGIAISMDDRIHLMHASSLEKKVVISDHPLAELLLKSKSQSGIMVARLK